jgi:hypothetical protein
LIEAATLLVPPDVAARAAVELIVDATCWQNLPPPVAFTGEDVAVSDGAVDGAAAAEEPAAEDDVLTEPAFADFVFLVAQPLTNPATTSAAIPMTATR